MKEIGKKLFGISLSLCVCLSLCSKIFAVETEFIKNGDFSNGLSNWTMNHNSGADGEMKVTDEGLNFQINNANGDNVWELGLVQQGLQLKDGVKYILSFDAKTTIGDNSKAFITVEREDNWAKNLEAWRDISSEFQHFTCEFTKQQGDRNQLVISLGIADNIGKSVTFNNISLIEAPVQKIGTWLLDEQNDTKGILSGTAEKPVIKIIENNNQFWDLSLKKREIELGKNKRYEVSFDIISDKSGTISFDLESMNDYNDKTIGRTMLPLIEGKNSFHYEFLQATNDQQSLVFFLSQGEGNTNMKDGSLKIENLNFNELNDLSDIYVVNGTFNDGIAGWQISNNNGADLKAEVIGGKAVLSFATSQGNDFWDSKFVQDNISVKSGQYRVSFDIGSDAIDTDVYFSVESTAIKDGKAEVYFPTATGQPQAIRLSHDKTMQSYHFDFNVLIEDLINSNEDLTIRFDLGKPYNGSLLGKQLYLDNIKLERIGDVVQTNIPKTEVNFDVNHIITDDFKGMGVQWDPYQVHPLTAAEWDMVTSRVDYLNPSFVRSMIYATTYCKGLDANGKPIFDFESPEMQPLIQQLDYLEDRQIETVFGEWEAPGKIGGTFAGITCDSPIWSEIIGGLMDYLINQKGYTCIKYYNYVNEANSDWSYCGDYDKWQMGIQHLHQKFEEIGIADKVKITGPDTVWDNNHSWLKNIENDSQMREKIGLWDVHMYPTYDEIISGYIESFVTEQRNVVTGKDFYMTEIGMVTGKVDGDTQKYAKEFCYGTIMADAAAQVMRGGLSGIAIWDLDDAMHNQDNAYPDTDIRSLKQWGFWNSIAGRVYNQPDQEKIRPHFYTWSLMTHLFPRHCQIIESSSTQQLNGLRTVGMKMANGQMTYMIVNDSNVAKEVKVKDNSDIHSRKVIQYNYFDNDREVDANGYPVKKQVIEDADFTTGVNVSLPSGGVVFLTTLDTDDYKQETQVKFENTDALTDEKLLGSDFTLKNQNGDVIDNWKSQETAHLIKGLNTKETYILTQNHVAKGYVLVKDLKINLKDSIQLQTVEIKNEHIKGKVNIIVKDFKTNKLIPNAHYVIKDKTGKILEYLKTDTQGKAVSRSYEIFKFKDGIMGRGIDYYLEENGDLKNYQKDNQKYHIQFDYKNSSIIEKEIVIQRIESKKINSEVNNEKNSTVVITNGSTNNLLLISILVISEILIGCIIIKKRKKKIR